MPELGDQPIEPEYRERMKALARFLDEHFNGVPPDDEIDRKAWMKDRPTGFVLLVFKFHQPDSDDSRCNFISNGADRRDVVSLFKEMIARMEGMPDVKGRA